MGVVEDKHDIYICLQEIIKKNMALVAFELEKTI